jgi:hypothetical protein
MNILTLFRSPSLAAKNITTLPTKPVLSRCLLWQGPTQFSCKVFLHTAKRTTGQLSEPVYVKMRGTTSNPVEVKPIEISSYPIHVKPREILSDPAKAKPREILSDPLHIKPREISSHPVHVKMRKISSDLST